jgi:general secretion pathway protein D
MKKVLDPLISKTSIILSYPPAGMLIITDVQSNIKRLQDIVAALDVEGVGEVISYPPGRRGDGDRQVVDRCLPASEAGVVPIRIVADERTNSVILWDRTEHEQYQAHLLMDKDIPVETSMSTIPEQQRRGYDQGHMNIPKETTAPETTAAGRPLPWKTPVLSKDERGRDKATNTLIITADRDDYKILEEVIQKLDLPRPMVYIEALIMEVSVNKNFNIGVEWRQRRFAPPLGAWAERDSSAWPASPVNPSSPSSTQRRGLCPCPPVSPWGLSVRGSRSGASCFPTSGRSSKPIRRTGTSRSSRRPNS